MAGQSSFCFHLTLVGAYYDEVPPVPIPNTEVKLISAHNTWREAAWEDRSVPALCHFGLIPILFGVGINQVFKVNYVACSL